MKLQDYLHYYLYGNIYEVGVTTCQLIGIGDTYYTIKTKQGTLLTLSNRANIKLVLRRLEDMPEKEGIEMFGTDRYWDIVCKEGKWDLFSSKEFQYLLQQHFDLFGLIPAGLAIDIKTITP